jgi:hypothetical protein
MGHGVYVSTTTRSMPDNQRQILDPDGGAIG